MEMRRLKMGIIGCGMVAQVMHIPHLLSLPHLFEVVGLCDLSAGTVSALSQRYSIPHTFTSAENMLTNLNLDAVLILTPYHFPVAMAALDSNVHVFVEKPMCVNEKEASALVAKAKSQNLIGQVGYHKPYDAGFRLGAELIKGMDSIRLATMHIAHGPNEPFLDHHQIIRFDDIEQEILRETGQAMQAAMVEAIGEQPPHLKRAYGSLLGGGCHQLSIMQGCLGRVEEVLHTEVWNEGKSITSSLVFEGGVRCLFSSVSMPDIRMFNEAFTAYSDSESIAIRFPSPFLKNAPTLVQKCGMEGPNFSESEVVADYSEAFRNEFIHFYHAVVKGNPPLTPLEQGAEDARIMIEIISKSPDYRP